MSSPITSVPDPSETSALASIITQVQPGQVPVVNRAPKATDPSRKKKKKKAAAAVAAEEEAAAQLKSQDEAVAAAARLGSQAASSQARAQSSVAGGAAPAIPGSAVLTVEGQEGHAQQASSTVVGGSTAGNTLTSSAVLPAAGGEEGEDKREKVPTGTESSEGTVEKDGLIDVPPRKHAAPTTATSAPATGTPAANASTTAATAAAPATSTAAKTSTTKPASAQRSTAKSKPTKPSFGQRLLAILTCSSATSAAVHKEMREKSRPATASVPARNTTPASATAAAAPRTPTSKTPAPPSSTANTDYPTTPSGGTVLPHSETGDVMSGAVVPPGSSFVTDGEAGKSRASSLSSGDETTSDDELEEDDYLTDDQTEEQRLILQGGMGIPLDDAGNPCPLLPPIGVEDSGRKCLVLDLDETLVHSSFKLIQNADFIVPVEIDGTVHNVYVIKRPGVDEFMRAMGLIYEVVVFTASLSKYADPVLDMLDIHTAVRHRLFRESCYNHKGNYVKDLSQLGREIGDTIIIDNSPASYIFHPNNAVPISSWFNDPHDTELTDLCPFLADLAGVDDVRAVLDGGL